jgi:GTP-binding protein Era
MPRFGYVAIIGRPNVGKSTLVNKLLGQKLAIVSPKPQTTSRRLRAIVNAPEGQLVLVDTPGLHAGAKAVNRGMVREARRSLDRADAVLAITDPAAEEHEDEEALLREALADVTVPKVLALNKVDLLGPAEAELMLAARRAEGGYAEAVGISAKAGRNLDALLAAIWRVLPEGEAVFPADILSDQPERDFFAEMIREQIFHTVRQELPYSTAVVIDEVREQPAPPLYRIQATIFVERESQKGMVIGKGGEGLRRIGEAARREMEAMTGTPVFLKLWVKVRKNWTRDEHALREFGFEPE